MLQCSREISNAHDPYTVKVMKAGTNYGWALAEEKKLNPFTVIRKGGTIDCEVTEPNRKYSRDLLHGGLEIPCVLTLQGIKDLVEPYSIMS